MKINYTTTQDGFPSIFPDRKIVYDSASVLFEFLQSNSQ